MNSETLPTFISARRPELKQNSIKSYVIIIKKILGDDFKSLTPLYKHEKILTWLDKNVKSSSTLKNYVTAITVALDASPRQTKKVKESAKYYRMIILAREKARKQFVDTHEQTEKQKEGWRTFDELKEASASLEARAVYLSEKETPLNKLETCELQNYIISLFYVNPPILPRLEIANLEVLFNNQVVRPFFDKERRNYISWNKTEEGNTMELVINRYKTDKHFGCRKCMLPKHMVEAIEMLIMKTNPNIILPYECETNIKLFLNLSENMLGKRISSIFSKDGSKTTLNTIRHIVISKFVDLEKESQLEELSQQAGHSRSQQLEYAKYQAKN